MSRDPRKDRRSKRRRRQRYELWECKTGISTAMREAMNRYRRLDPHVSFRFVFSQPALEQFMGDLAR